MSTEAEVLERGPLFSGVERPLIELVLQVGRRRSFKVLETVMKQGEVASSMFVILSGRVRVVRHTADGGSFSLAELGPGDGVGEIGLIDQRPRSATVIAIEPTDALEIDAVAFEAISHASPRFGELLTRVLSDRLRATNELVERRLTEAGTGVPAAEPAPPPGAQAETNRALVTRYRTLLAEQRWDELDALLASGFTLHGKMGAKAVEEDARRLAATLGALRTTIRQVVADDEWVVELTTLSGVHEGRELAALADFPVTGKQLTFDAVFFYRIADGKIAERLTVADEVGALQRAGAQTALT